MLSTGLALGTLALLIGSQNIGPPDAATNCPNSIIGLSTLTYPDTSKRPGFILDISRDAVKSETYFPDDFLVLRVLSREWVSKVLGEMKFSSSYGRFELCLVDLTGDGTEEFVLVTGEGHGSGVRNETLAVWQRVGRTFRSLLQVPLSGHFGMDQWWYRREFKDINGDGILDLRLVLEHDTPLPGSTDAVEDIPKTKLREFVFDANNGRMVPYQRKPKGAVSNAPTASARRR